MDDVLVQMTAIPPAGVALKKGATPWTTGTPRGSSCSQQSARSQGITATVPPALCGCAATHRELCLTVAPVGEGTVSWLNERSSALKGSPASLGGLHEASRLCPLLGHACPHDGFFRSKGTNILEGVSRRHAQSRHTDD